MLGIKSLSFQEQKAVSRFKKEVGKICGHTDWQLKIFGSRARMEGSEESDLDVLIVIPEKNEKQKVAIWDAAYRIFTDTDILVSAHVLSKVQFEQMKMRERLIIKEIERDGFTV